jgi:hypothetical protein
VRAVGHMPQVTGVLQMENGSDELREAMDAEEKAIVDALTPGQLEAIDAVILQSGSARWSKVARILGGFLKAQPGVPANVPLEFVWERLCLLVTRGDLESKGDLRGWGTSEVRLP